MYYKMQAPQNLHVLGLTSKVFSVQFIHNIQTEDFQLFIESILSDLIDTIGDTFKANISLYKNKSVLIASNKSTISFVFPEYHWLSDIGIKISEFLKNYDKLMYVTVGFSHQELNSNKHEHIFFSLIAKNGSYIEKKMTSIDMTLRTVSDHSFCHGQQVPDYNVTTIDI